MKVTMLRSVSLLALASAALAANAQTSFYGGDYDGNNAVITSQGANYARIYDDFTLGQATNVQSVFGNFIGRSSTLYYEIRQGVSAGNGGTLLYSGTIAATSTVNGTSRFGSIYNVSGQISGVTLGPGTYFLGLAGSSYLVTASGANGVGGPLNNDLSYFDGQGYGTPPFASTATVGNQGATDFSMGLNGVAATPGPAAALAFGVGLIRRRRKA
jgi:hypothetical protein